MATGGKLKIDTANVVLDEAYMREHVGTITGAQVMIAVTPTRGMGIPGASTPSSRRRALRAGRPPRWARAASPVPDRPSEASRRDQRIDRVEVVILSAGNLGWRASRRGSGSPNSGAVVGAVENLPLLASHSGVVGFCRAVTQDGTTS